MEKNMTALELHQGTAIALAKEVQQTLSTIWQALEAKTIYLEHGQ